MKKCDHDSRTRYDIGFQCNERCLRFFSRDTIEWKRSDGLSELWCAIHNYMADFYRKKVLIPEYLITLENKIFKAYQNDEAFSDEEIGEYLKEGLIFLEKNNAPTTSGILLC